ncbi:hypothetical protein X777_03499 [Ooceraea biroi]|uniref:Uncharacterized protein n=1 Tax=Ooceraea biroi TaxID=2015173 RepID=A0A026WJF0_OOCBI|nr:hypothetical protein X777_03499 [Ooceraea biroi]
MTLTSALTIRTSAEDPAAVTQAVPWLLMENLSGLYRGQGPALSPTIRLCIPACLRTSIGSSGTLYKYRSAICNACMYQRYEIIRSFFHFRLTMIDHDENHR